MMDEALLPLLRTTLGSEALAAGHAPMVVDMGICWTVARLDSAAACLALSPNAAALDELMRRTASNGVAVYGPHAAGSAADYEVRTFFVENGVPIEDPCQASATGTASTSKKRSKLAFRRRCPGASWPRSRWLK